MSLAVEPRITICVFAKPPCPGKTKTRLAAKVGDVRAAELAQAFLLDTWALVSSVGWASGVIATTEATEDRLGLPGRPSLWIQGDGDLGDRLERVLRHALTRADSVIAIGADTPGLPARLLVEAAHHLTRSDAVLGPSEDGGFYLLGLRRCPPGLLRGLPWSEPTTFAATQARLVERGLRVRTLDSWFDVDRPEDLERLQRSIDAGAIHAPATARLLEPSPRQPR